jgi:hypothetical protein
MSAVQQLLDEALSLAPDEKRRLRDALDCDLQQQTA